jgi:hypothetical protein
LKKLDELLKKAAIVRGSVLQLDCIQAETFLKWRKAVIKSVRRIQAVVRGNFGRSIAKKLKLKRRAYLKYLKDTRLRSIDLSRVVVSDYLRQGMR